MAKAEASVEELVSMIGPFDGSFDLVKLAFVREGVMDDGVRRLDVEYLGLAQVSAERRRNLDAARPVPQYHVCSRPSVAIRALGGY